MTLDRNHALIRTGTLTALAAFGASGAWPSIAFAQEQALVLTGQQIQGAAVVPAATASLMVQVQNTPGADLEPHALRAVSMFAIAPAESRIFHEHDLIQIIVRESTAGKATHETDTEKDVSFKGAVTQWPDFQLSNLLTGMLAAGNTDGLPQVDLKFTKEFEGEGEYKRRDDFTARLTSEVLQVLPNGNLILESRTRMKQDQEEFTLKVTGTCRPEDITPANTILSSQLHDLKVEKITNGMLKKANEKGLFTQFLDLLFAF
jgi:flagellar L-ring protein precursor FlgH